MKISNSLMKPICLSTFLLVALTSPIASADVGPGWYTQPWMIPSHPQKVTTVQYPLVLQKNYNGPITSSPLPSQLQVSEVATPEIVSLASNLENDRRRIFDYVHNYIRYTHYFGSKKGAYLTFLEGSGNDFDQCALLVALLRAATTNNPTVNNYTVSYQFGMMRIPYEAQDNVDLKHWLGLKFSGNGNDTLDLIDNVYAGGGFPLYQPNPDINLKRYVLVPWENGQADKTSFYVHRVWVKLHDNNGPGPDIYLDPAFKTGIPIGGLDLSTAMGLDLSELSADAKQTWSGGIHQTPQVTPNYVQYLNYSKISDRLTTYTGNLLGQLQTTYKNISPDDIISDYRIQESETCVTCAFPGLPFAPQQNTPFDVDNFGAINPDSKIVPVREWDNIPDTYMSTLSLKIDQDAITQIYDVNRTYKLPELKARKLTLTFPSKKSTISLDDAVDTVGTITTTATITTASMITTVTNPFGTWDYVANSLKDVPADNRSWQKDGEYGTVTYRRDSPGYVIAYNFDDPSQLLTERRQKLDALMRQGLATTNSTVVTETLNVLGLSWFQQTYLAQRILAGQNDVLVTTWHRVGRVAQENPKASLGYYVDIKMQRNAVNPRSQPVRSAISSRNAFSDMWAFAFSAMEHGVIEQLQPMTAASTIKTIYQANLDGERLILLTPNNVQDHWTAYKNYFLGYAAYPGAGTILSFDVADQIMSQLQPGVNVFIPGGSPPIGSWKGSGYVMRTQTPSGETAEMAMLISSAYGGYSGSPAWVDPFPVNNIYLNWPTIFDPVSALLGRYLGADPVNMIDGSFTVDSLDFSVGQPEPRGFSFSRHYDTNRRFYNDANLGYGWTHNYLMKAAELSDPAAALGKTTPQAMAAFLVAMRAATSVFTAPNDPPPPVIGPPPPPRPFGIAPLRWGVAALIANWGVDQLKNNAVTLTLGKDAVEFIKQPDGSFTPPAGARMTLTKPAGYQLQMRHGNTFKFDGKNKQVTNIVDQYSKEMKFTYMSATDRRLKTVVDCWGRTLTFGYDGQKKLTSVTDGTRWVKFGLDQTTNLTSVTDPESKTWTYQYDDHKITRTLDPLSPPRVITQNIYDSDGKVVQQLSQGDPARTWNIYAAGNRVSVQKDPKGGKGGRTTYYFDEKARLIATKDPNNNKTSSVYDGQDHVVQSITPKNESTYFEYDGRQNLTKITDPLLNFATFTYKANDTLETKSDFHDSQTQAHTTTYTYNLNLPLLVESITAPDVNDDPTMHTSTSFAYYESDNDPKGPKGMLKSQTEHDTNPTSRDYVTKFEYDSRGELSKVIYPSLNDSEFETNGVNVLGDVTNHADANGIVTQFEYNKRRQLTRTTVDPTAVNPSGLNIVTQIAYDDAGNAQTATDGRGFDTTSTYSATQKLLTKKFPQLADLSVPMTVNHYDERDWLDYTENPLLEKGKTSFEYYPAGQLKNTTDPLLRVTTYGYDEDGHKTSVTSPLQDNQQNPIQTTRYGYDARGKQTSLTDAADTLAEHPIRYTYDANGNQTIIQNRNLDKITRDKYCTFVNSYYGNNQLHTFQTPLSRTTAYQYVQRGMVQSITEPSGQTTTFQYDDRGRPKYKSDDINTPDATPTYTYDKNNNLLDHTENGKTIHRTYDHANRLYSYQGEDQTIGSIGYRYDNNGNLTKLIYPDSKAVNYEYDSNNRLTNVTDWSSRVTKLTYDIAGRPATITRPNGTVRQLTYDNANQLTSIDERTADGVVIYRFVANSSFYDGAGRLTAEGVSPPPGPFATPAINTLYNNDNQISQYKGATVQHDLDGNMTRGLLDTDTLPLVGYNYYARNRLTSVGGVIYTYDSEGNRLTMTQSGQSTTFVTVPSAAIPRTLIRIRPNNTRTYYVYGPALLYDVEMDANGNEATPEVRHTYHFDMRGSTVALTEKSGQLITDRMGYSPYGSPGTRTGNTDTPFLFNGRYGVMTDPNSLLFMQARYYNPLICRFINADPSGFSGGMNFYAFANGNPVSLLDPFGLGAVGESSGSSWFNTSSLGDIAYNASPAGQFMAAYHDTQAQMQQFTSFQQPPSGGVALSSALNMVPLVGFFKMSGEAFFGKDAVTGQRIENLKTHAAWGALNLGLTVGTAMIGMAQAAAAERTYSAYSVAFSAKLAPGELALSDVQHFNIANKALEAERAVNAPLAQTVPAPAGWGRPPANWTWQHATIEQARGEIGVLQLVPRYQHTAGSAWWSLFHPYPYGGGGYWEWAVPAGAPYPR